MVEVNKFSVFRSFYEIAQRLDDAERLAFYDAIFIYGFDGVEPVLDGIAAIGFLGIRPNIDSSVKGSVSGGSRPNAKTPDKKTYRRGVQTGGNEPPTDGAYTGGVQTDKEKERDREKDRERKEEKDLENSPYGENFQGSFQAIGGASAETAPPNCPICDAPMQSTASFKPDSQKRIYRCPLCAEEVAV